MNKPHKHAELIKAWADGAQIQCRSGGNFGDWMDTINPHWNHDTHYRVKPREFPKTSFKPYELLELLSPGTVLSMGPREQELWATRFTVIANEAIKQHILDEEAKST